MGVHFQTELKVASSLNTCDLMRDSNTRYIFYKTNVFIY